MTDYEMQNMLKDIINNGGCWECRKPGCINISVNGVATVISSPSNWVDYKLGEEIHSDWEYRKKEKWYVVRCNASKALTTVNQETFTRHFLSDDVLFQSYSKEECEKWVKEHTKWLESFIQDRTPNSENFFTKAEIALYEAGVRQGTAELGKKILEELKKDMYSLSYDGVYNLITDLGIKIPKEL